MRPKPEEAEAGCGSHACGRRRRSEPPSELRPAAGGGRRPGAERKLGKETPPASVSSPGSSTAASHRLHPSGRAETREPQSVRMAEKGAQSGRAGRRALPAASFPGPTVSPCGPGSAPLTWALDRCLRGGRPMPRGRVSGTAVSTQRMPEASLPALTAKDPRGRNPLLEAQRWGQGQERQTDEGEKRSHGERGRQLSRLREAVFCTQQSGASDELSLFLNQAVPCRVLPSPRPRSPEGESELARTAGIRAACQREPRRAGRGGGRPGTAETLRRPRLAFRLQRRRPSACPDDPGQRWWAGAAWPFSAFLLSIYYASHRSKSRSTVRASPYSPGIRVLSHICLDGAGTVPQEGQAHRVCSGNAGTGLQVTADPGAEGWAPSQTAWLCDLRQAS
ncbi:unnamed protein product [Rangifer tarandus platyrhynchus]|uniref:Uncharacterized protein n=1 Tax=Rangifer tarandus platyrhynchus TaxID=3082113 RepID=A0AC59YAP4_RANTA